MMNSIKIFPIFLYILKLQYEKYFVAMTTEEVQPLVYENGTYYYNSTNHMFCDYLVPKHNTHLGFLGLYDIEEVHDLIILDNPFDAHKYVLSLMAVHGIDNVRDNFMYRSYIMTDIEKLDIERQIYSILRRVYDCDTFDECCQMYRQSLLEYEEYESEEIKN